MNKGQKFFICKHCGNIIGLIENKGGALHCCGEKMQELVPNTVEASHEKHLPVVLVEGEKVIVQVGSVLHPMEETHYLPFVYLETENGGQRKFLSIGKEPKVEFVVTDDKPLAVYVYCNLHGLWKTQL